MMPSSLFNLPLELRLQIYSHLLTPEALADGQLDINGANWSGAIGHTYHEYEKSSAPSAVSCPRVFPIRNSKLSSKMYRRTRYKIRSGRLRSACEDASYACITRPKLHTSILATSWQIHDEAAELLYGSCVFDFDTDVEACVPFLMDLTPFSRQRIRHISIVKRAIPYDKDFDRCEWSTMCDYLSNHLQLVELSLGIVAGKPAVGWNSQKVFQKDEFAKVVEFMDEMSWVNDVTNVKGLRRLNVRACIEHSPPPMSSAMAFFVAFSASVEPHFADYLNSQMVLQAA